jgi:hypothetical protein
VLVVQTRCSRLLLALAALAGWTMVGVPLASACTIPVFRYALERWESDRFLVIVYHDGRLTAEQNTAIQDLSERSSLAGGPLNIEVIRYDLNSPPSAKLPDVQPPSADRPLPWVEVRARRGPMRTALWWQGPLAEALGQPGLFDSPARSEIVRRILAGHSSVWLVIASEKQSPKLSEQLQVALDDVTRGLAIPQGIGLPGSELYAPIPLEIRFSVLPISHTDPQEQQFLKWLATYASQWRTDTAYIVPVFGRCRALDVIPYAEADAVLMEDLANFLCGACSCQVKQANPGFDLLASVNWDQRLFGDSSSAQLNMDSKRPALKTSDPPQSPEYVAIPSGNRALGHADDRSTASRAPVDAAPLPELSGPLRVLLLAGLALVSGGILSGCLLARHWSTGS